MSEDLTKLYTAESPVEADLIKAFLNDNDIFAFVQGYHHRYMLGMAGPYIEANVLVREADLAHAQELLREYQEGHPHHDSESTSASTLPTQAKPDRHKNWKAAFIYAFFLPGLGNYYAGRKNLGGWMIMITVVLTIALFTQTLPIDLYGKLFCVIAAMLVLDAVSSARYLYKKNKQLQSYKVTKQS